MMLMYQPPSNKSKGAFVYFASAFFNKKSPRTSRGFYTKFIYCIGG